MRSYTRHELKEDGFASATRETVTWVAAHGRKLAIAAVVAALLLVAGVASWYYQQNRERQASILLGKALRTYQTPIRPQGAPADPGLPSFESAEARHQAAQADFRAVVDTHGSTRQALMARYFLGLVARDMGNAQDAEAYLQEVSGTRDAGLRSLAKFALASLYRHGGRGQDAIKLYRELIEQPTLSVPKETAQLELAAAYEADQPGEAARLYEQIRTEHPNSPAAQIAAARLSSVTAP